MKNSTRIIILLAAGAILLTVCMYGPKKQKTEEGTETELAEDLFVKDPVDRLIEILPEEEKEEVKEYLGQEITDLLDKLLMSPEQTDEKTDL